MEHKEIATLKTGEYVEALFRYRRYMYEATCTCGMKFSAYGKQRAQLKLEGHILTMKVLTMKVLESK